MKRANVLGAALVVAGLVATAAPAAAQVTVGADLGLFSDYVWRGISLHQQARRAAGRCT